MPAQLTDRVTESAAIDRLLKSVRNGEDGALFLHRQPGIDKTALLEHLAWTAAACNARGAAGVRSRMEIDLAALHRVCSPMLERQTTSSRL
jgi:hypothetical protein